MGQYFLQVRMINILTLLALDATNLWETSTCTPLEDDLIFEGEDSPA